MLDRYISVKENLRLNLFDDKQLKDHNLNFIKKGLIKYQDYFDHLYDEINPNVSLDLNQRIAILTDENYNLIIAGAGSGKTTTMIGKIRYLIDKCGIKGDEILALSFARKNVSELDEKLNKILKLNVDVKTFHQLGKNILESNNIKKRPIDDGKKYNLLKKYMQKELFKNKDDLKNMMTFLSYYSNVDESMMKFNSFEEYHKYKSECLFKSIKDNLKEYNNSVIKKRSKFRRSIQSEYLKSNEELKIANFLFLNGLEYEYEQRYIYDNDRIYLPDFTIKQGENIIYLEHFGISQNGSSNLYSFNALNKYMHNINIKKQIHERNGTKMIVTYSKFNDGRPLLSHLEELLIANGFILKPINEKEIFKKLTETDIDSYYYHYLTLAMEFISKIKLKNLSIDELDNLINITGDIRTKQFLMTIKPLYLYYQQSLERGNFIDFEDMIVKATLLLKNNQFNFDNKNYKYLIIDEYQDISKPRFDLIKTLSDIFSCNIVAVGDDWQSIFSFAGSNVELFTKFKEEMGYAEVLKITNTYRNCQELIDVAGEFVQRDENNIKKTLHSNKHIEKPICVYSYIDDRGSNLMDKAETLCEIIKNIYDENQNSKILLIGRYNYDMEKLFKTNLFYQFKEKIICNECKKANIEFATVHRSKGLEFDEVIIINAIDDTFGFPSKIKDDPIFSIINEKANRYAEERRLFYVALTRTKNKVYIVVPQSKPSPFVLELKNNKNVEFKDDVINKYNYKMESLICPICGNYLRKQYFDGLKQDIYCCSSEDEICGFKTTNLTHKINLKPCPKCNGYVIFKTITKNNNIMLGCSNYDISDGCKYVEFINKEKSSY